MTAKEYLEQVRSLDRRVNVKLAHVDRLRAMTENVTASCGGEHVSHTRNLTSMQDTIVRRIEAEESLNADIDRLAGLKSEITGVLSRIRDTDCQILLELRYLWLHSWKEIAEMLHMHIRTVYKVHERALQKLDAVMQADHLSDVRDDSGSGGTPTDS